MKLTKHTTSENPINPESWVIYRTINKGSGLISHIHAPVQAKHLNWRTGNNTRRIGQLYDYAIVKINPMNKLYLYEC